MLSLLDLRDACRGQRLFWTTHRASAFFGTHDIFPNNVVLCTDDSPENDGVPGTRFFSYEATSRRRPAVRPGIETMLHDGWTSAEPEITDPGWHALVSLRHEAVTPWAQRTGSTLHAHSRDVLRALNDKRTLFRIVRELELPRLPGEWTTADAYNFAHWQKHYGTSFVVQAPTGMGGSGTAFVGTEAEWHQACAHVESEELWIAPDHGPLSLNTNGIAVPHASVAGYPSIQLTGFDFLNHTRAMYCGNDFSAMSRVPKAVREDVRLQTERIGNHIASLGYVGLFGLDFVVSDCDGIARAVDLNPRWQGSTPLFAQAQRVAGVCPLPAASVLFETGLLSASELARVRDDFFAPVQGAQVRMRAGPASCEGGNTSLRPGIYASDGTWTRPGLLLEQLAEGEVLLTGGPPRPGTYVEPGAQWFRICGLTSMLQASSLQPAPWIRDLTRAVVASRGDQDTRRK